FPAAKIIVGKRLHPIIGERPRAVIRIADPRFRGHAPRTIVTIAERRAIWRGLAGEPSQSHPGNQPDSNPFPSSAAFTFRPVAKSHAPPLRHQKYIELSAFENAAKSCQI